MRYFWLQDGTWTETNTPPPTPPFARIDEDEAAVEFVGENDDHIRFTGAPVDPGADTIHSLMTIDPSFQKSYPLCAVYVRGQSMDVEDRRSPGAPSAHADAVAQLRSALDEILIPVYIDDAIEEVSGAADGLMVLHTVQYDDGPDAPATYFRVAVVQDGDVRLEAEDGAL